MPLVLCKLAHPVREFQRLRKIVEGKGASQALDAIELDEFPASDLGPKSGDLRLRRRGCVFAARDTLHLRERLHLPVSDQSASPAASRRVRVLLPVSIP